MTSKRALSVLIILISIIAFSTNASAIIPDLDKWNDCALYSVVNDGADSNSAVECVIIRVDPDLESNQLHMMFLLNLDSFEDESKAGIKMKLNNIGTVELYCDSRTQYNTDLFFAEIDNIYSDPITLTLYIEFTVGIKSGIPDNLIISFNLYDTQGIASNTYSIDITDSYIEEISEEISDEDSTDTDVKITKTRATANKTAKVKTVKVKTTKSKKSKAEATDVESYDYEENEATLQQEVFDDVHMENDKNKLIIICAAAVIACTLGGCTVGIINSRKTKKNSKGDDK